MNLLGILEGILFVSGDEGVTLNQICEILEIDIEEAKKLLLELKQSYENDNRGIRVSYLGDAFKLTTIGNKRRTEKPVCKFIIPVLHSTRITVKVFVPVHILQKQINVLFNVY